jgi:adenylate kinase family enzyme
VVVGTSGAGKTTFARRLAERLGVSRIELDALYWGPSWVPREPAAFRALVAEAIAAERWVLDGNYSAVRELVWARATSFVWLDYGLSRVVWQVLTRTLGRALRREELFGGKRESLRGAFLSRESILLRAITTFHRRRRQYRAFFDAPFPHPRTIRFGGPREAEAFLRGVSAET